MNNTNSIYWAGAKKLLQDWIAQESKKHQVKIGPSQQLIFRQFIKELKEQKEGGFCTTQTEYEIEYGEEAIKKVAGNCGWFGFSELKAALFGDNN